MPNHAYERAHIVFEPGDLTPLRTLAWHWDLTLETFDTGAERFQSERLERRVIESDLLLSCLTQRGFVGLVEQTPSSQRIEPLFWIEFRVVGRVGLQNRLMQITERARTEVFQAARRQNEGRILAGI